MLYGIAEVAGGSAGMQDSGDSIYCVASVPASGAIPSQLLLGSKRGRLYLWDLRQAGVLWTVAQLQDKILGCAASPCARRVVAGSRAGQVPSRIFPTFPTLAFSFSRRSRA
jgi:hypothetical protein